MKRLFLSAAICFCLAVLLDAQNSPASFYKPSQITTDTMRYSYTYNDSGRVTLQLNEVHRNGAWDNYQRISNGYNTEGNKQTSTLTENWSNGNWVGFSRASFTYDGTGRINTMVSEMWFNGSWQNSSEAIWYYNNESKVDSIVWHNWSQGAWVNGTRISYTYDTNGRQHTVFYELWLNNEWKSSSIYTYTYDGSGRPSDFILEMWINGVRQNYNKYIYSYNSISKIESTTRQNWNGAWVDSWRQSNTYDPSGNLVTVIEMNYINTEWVHYSKINYTYDTAKNGVHGEYFLWNGNTWNTALGNMICYYNNGGFNMVFGKYYDAVYTTTSDIQDESLTANSFTLQQNYPNPFNPSTTINYSLPTASKVKLSIYDALGSEAAILVDDYKPAGNYSVYFNGNSLASGVYFYRLEALGHSISKKLILIK